MRWMISAVILTLSISVSKSEDPLKERIEKLINSPEYQQASWGILAVDAVSGKEIYKLNSEKMFAPASTTKLFSCAAALVELGSQHTFETNVYQRGVAFSGILDGDLILVASGDPTMGGRNTPEGKMAFKNNDHTYANAGTLAGELTDTDPLLGLTELAKQIAATGIKEVAGEILIDDRLFDRSSSSGSGPNQVTPITINDNLVDILIAPGDKKGDSAKLTMRPQTDAVQMDAEVMTGDENLPPALTIFSDGPNRFRIRGRIPAKSKPKLVVYPVDDPVNYARTLFIECLRKQGVRVVASKFEAKRNNLPAKAGYDNLQKVATFKSLPLSELIKVTLKVSHNLYASTLPLLLAAKKNKTNLTAGLREEGKILSKLGVEISSISFAGGAGGMQADHTTPAATVDLLKAMAKHPESTTYYNCLPVIGVDGTLYDVLKPDSATKGKVRAKTGTLSWHDVMNDRTLLASKALAGDLETKSGKRLFIALFVNNVPLDKGATPSREGKMLAKICEAFYELAP